MSDPIAELREHGQSVWFDYIRRGLITSGELSHLVRDRVITGMTSNPTIFRKAIAGSSDYGEALRAVAERGERDPYEGFLAIGGEDIRLAADELRSVYDATDGADGYVSFEAQENDVAEMVAEAKRMFALVDRPNVMIKVPGTDAGIAALEQLIADGINVNVTLLFDTDVYERVANGYIAGLERRLDARNDISRLASVASFFVSRVDTKVDERLPDDSPLRGRVAIANAREAYRRFQRIFSGERWRRLADAGARVQRPLWASTGTKNSDYSDVMYVEELVARDTVNTMPEATLDAFRDHGRVRPAVEEGLDDATQTLAAAEDAGIDLRSIGEELLKEGLGSFGKDFQGLLDEVGAKLREPPAQRFGGALGPLAPAVEERLDAMAKEDVVRRIWSGDHTVWKPDPAEITNRLGWLTTIDAMMERADELRHFAEHAWEEGHREAVLLGMGGSSLAPEVLFSTFGAGDDGLKLTVLDTTDPATIREIDDRFEPAKTLFVVASKSGTTVETLSHLAHFWERVPDGAHYVAITDPGTSLATLGRERGFRKVFANQADIGGRYSALSHFGLVPAALGGVDIDELLDRAHEQLHACHHCVPVVENPGAWLGAVLGEAARAGRDKLTLVLPDEIATLGHWIEQLIAESTGKEGKGILPVEGEPLGAPDVYGDDRLFVAIGEHDGLDALESAGHPIVRLPYRDRLQLGAEFLRWEFATAVAGHVLGINPFDQPNVQEAKDATAAILDGSAPSTHGTPSLAELLSQVGEGNYIAIQAYLPRTSEIDARLQSARVALRDRYRVATTVGYGPRFLHSTGQLHKGGPDTGIFVQVVDDDGIDVDVPGKPYTFGELKRAQALGDLQSLQSRGQRIARATVDELQEVTR